MSCCLVWLAIFFIPEVLVTGIVSFVFFLACFALDDPEVLLWAIGEATKELARRKPAGRPRRSTPRNNLMWPDCRSVRPSRSDSTTAEGQGHGGTGYGSSAGQSGGGSRGGGRCDIEPRGSKPRGHDGQCSCGDHRGYGSERGRKEMEVAAETMEAEENTAVSMQRQIDGLLLVVRHRPQAALDGVHWETENKQDATATEEAAEDMDNISKARIAMASTTTMVAAIEGTPAAVSEGQINF